MPRSKKSKKKVRKIDYKSKIFLYLILLISATVIFTLIYQSKMTSDKKLSQQLLYPVSYEGTTPCADCTGIKTTLTLNSTPNTYTQQLIYLGKPAEPFVEKGTWRQENKYGKTVYTLTSDLPNSTVTVYQILSSTQIRQLSGDGSEIPSELPFTLTKTE